MHVNGYLHRLRDLPHQEAEGTGHDDAHGVGKVDALRTGVDCGCHHLLEKVQVGSGGVRGPIETIAPRSRAYATPSQNLSITS